MYGQIARSVVLGFAIGLAVVPQPSRAACPTAFQVVPSPNVGIYDNGLRAAAAVSATNSWAIGYTSAPAVVGSVHRTLVEHYNGIAWSIVASANAAGSITDDLFALAARSASDIWTVGNFFNGNTGGTNTLALHWNGLAWTLIPTPVARGLDDELFGVSVVPSTATAWAVGYYQDFSNKYATLINFWNGSRWIIVPSPNVGPTGSQLFSVTALSATNVWATGAYVDSFYQFRTLVEHFNGITWNVVPSPNLDTQYGQDNNFLYRTAAIPGTADVWAVGAAVLDVPSSAGGARSTQPLSEEWNGARWTIVPNPLLLPYQGNYFATVALSRTQAWAVGYQTAPTTPFDQTLVERWNGARWTILPSPNVGSLASDFAGLAAAPITATLSHVWAVGQYGSGNYTSPGPTRTLIEEACQ